MSKRWSIIDLSNHYLSSARNRFGSVEVYHFPTHTPHRRSTTDSPVCNIIGKVKKRIAGTQLTKLIIASSST